MREYPAIIAALPREIKPLVAGWQQHRLPNNIHAYTKGDAVVACAGMGPERVALAVQAAISLKPVTTLLSVGLAGACNPALRVGDIVRAGVVIDASSGERYDRPQLQQVLVTASAIASIIEKQRLHASYSADAVDMEAARVARLARAHDLNFAAIKVISDEADFELEALGRFATADGQFREAAFATYAALRPWMWSKLIGLGRNSARAVQALTAALESELDWYRKRA